MERGKRVEAERSRDQRGPTVAERDRRCGLGWVAEECEEMGSVGVLPAGMGHTSQVRQQSLFWILVVCQGPRWIAGLLPA